MFTGNFSRNYVGANDQISPGYGNMFTLGAVIVSIRSKHIDKLGGAYAFSPDGLWIAEISDGYSKVHGRFYAVIRLWDINKYPSLRGNGIRAYFGIFPTAEMRFPQDFHARDSEYEAIWNPNSSGFKIEFARSALSNHAQENSIFIFQYDISDDMFSLRERYPRKSRNKSQL